jgi:hypothetical protein
MEMLAVLVRNIRCLPCKANIQKRNTFLLSSPIRSEEVRALLELNMYQKQLLL